MKKNVSIIFAVLLALFSVHRAKASDWVGEEVQEGTYFLYNTASKQFLCGGNNWGTRASLDTYGIDVTLALYNEGYSIDTRVSNGGTSNFLGVNGFVDAAVAEWTFTNVGTEGQFIYELNTGEVRLGFDGTSSIVTLAAETGSDNAKWILISKDQVLDRLSTATATSGVDASLLIAGRDFYHKDPRNNSWVGDAPAIGGAASGSGNTTYLSQVAEFYNKNYDMYQEITGLPNGFYTVSCQGFYRAGGFAAAAELHEAGAYEYNASFYVNDVATPLQSIFDCTTEDNTLGGIDGELGLGFFPNNMTAAAAYFKEGLYNNNSVTVLVTDGTLKIGLAKDSLLAADWTLFDAFRMTYNGPEIVEEPKDPSMWIGEEVQEGTYYLYNVANKQFLCAGNDWGTRGSFNDVGLDFVLAELDGTYTLFSAVRNSDVQQYLTTGGYVDGAAIGWTFTNVGDEGQFVYNISSGDALIGSAEGSTILALTAADEAAQWLLISKEQRLAMLALATEENGVDASFLIRGADFGRNDTRNTTWQGGPVIGGAVTNYVGEKFATGFDVYQELTDLPNGSYTVSCQGFYRAGAAADAAVLFEAGEYPYNAMLYANSAMSPLQSIFDAATEDATLGGIETTSGFVPNTMAATSTYFTNGLYANNSVTVVVLDGTLRFGVSKTVLLGSDWTIFDRFRLTYNGPLADLSAYYDQIAAALAKATELESQKMVVTAAAGMTAATAAFDTSKSDYTENELIAILSGLTAAIDVAEKSVADFVKIAAAVAKSTELEGEKMSATASSGMATAVALYDAEKADYTQDDVDTILTSLTAAVTAAETSVAGYVELAGWIESAEGVLARIVAEGVDVEGLATLDAAKTVYDGATSEEPVVVGKTLWETLIVANFDGTEMTELIANPTAEATGEKTVAPEGWLEVERGNTYWTSSEYPGDATKTYLDSWNGTAGALAFTVNQVLEQLPAGIYALTAEARTSGAGSYIYVNGEDKTSQEEIINNGAGLNNGALGYGWSTITVLFTIKDNSDVIIGLSTNPTYSGGNAWEGTWVGATNFKLYQLEKLTPTGVAGVTAEAGEPFDVYNTSGQLVRKAATSMEGLAKGIYVVSGKKYAVK